MRSPTGSSTGNGAKPAWRACAPAGHAAASTTSSADGTMTTSAAPHTAGRPRTVVPHHTALVDVPRTVVPRRSAPVRAADRARHMAGPGDSAHLRATAVPAVRAPDSSTGRAAGSAHPRDCRVAARSRRAAPLPSHLSRRPNRPRRSARTITSTSPTSMPVTRSRMTSTGWAPSSTRRTRAATP